MKISVQIFCALALTGAAAAWPLYSIMARITALKKEADRTASIIKVEPTDNPLGSADTLGSKAKRVEGATISPGVSPKEAAEIIANLGALDGRLLTGREILEVMQGVMNLPVTHLEDAFSVVNGVKNPMIGAFLVSGIFARWGELDPDGATAKLSAKDFKNPLYKGIASSCVGPGWLAKDPEGFIKYVSVGSGEGGNGELENLKRELLNNTLRMSGDLDPATLNRLIEAAAPDRRANMIMDFAEQDEDVDLSEATDRALSYASDDKAKGDILQRAARSLAARDPKEALKFVESRIDEKEQGQAYAGVFGQWINKDQDEALKWLGEQPPERQTTAVDGIGWSARDWKYDDIEKRVAGLDPKAGEKVWASAVGGAAERDPREAMRYLPKMNESARPGAHQNIAETWTKDDPEASSTWIDGLPNGKEKNAAIVGMTQQLSDKEPDSSTIWAATITDEKQRATTVAKHAERWMKRDAAAATEWIHTTESITQEQKDKLLKIP